MEEAAAPVRACMGSTCGVCAVAVPQRDVHGERGLCSRKGCIRGCRCSSLVPLKDTCYGALRLPWVVALVQSHHPYVAPSIASHVCISLNRITLVLFLQWRYVFDVPDEEGENLVKPSLAFCKAVDNEDEYDQIDEMASRSLGGHPPRDTLPDRRMEVAPSFMPYGVHGRIVIVD